MVDEIREEHEPWLRDSNVVGFGVGYKTRRHRRLPELVLTVFVREKRPPDLVVVQIPNSIRIPTIVEKVPLDVVQVGASHLQAYSEKQRPAFPGCGISDATHSYGTLGCLAKVDGDPNLYLISSAYVIAASGEGVVGTRIMQPSVAYGGIAGGDDIAELTNWTTFDFGAEYPNEADAASARILDPAQASAFIPPAIGIPRGTATVDVDDRVVKSGQSTEYTMSEVVYTDCHVEFDYDYPTGKQRGGFSGQVMCRLFTGDGDSGALVLNEQLKAVGLHLGVFEGYSVFNPIDAVQSALGVKIVTRS